MGWTTIYIQGRSGCSDEVLRNLEHSNIKFMPGSATGELNTALYWVDEKTSLREFKKAIGSKTIFKYRLRFFSSLEKATDLQRNTTEFTQQEKALVKKMSAWEAQHRFQYSA